MSRLTVLQQDITACRRCPRLVAHRERVARVKTRRFRDDAYWGKPVPGFGPSTARLLIVGLAPAAHGANRTGRVFTGDGVGGSGDFLMSALNRAGFASISTSQRPDDGLQLRDAFILAAVRCALERHENALENRTLRPRRRAQRAVAARCRSARLHFRTPPCSSS